MNAPRTRTRLIASALVIVLAAVGWLAFVSSTSAVPSRLSALVIADPGLPGLKAEPGGRRPIAANVLPFPPAAKATGGGADTGGYAASWQTSAKSAAGATTANVLLELLPDRSSAGHVRTTAVQRYTDPKALAQSSLAVTSHFTVPGVPGAAGIALASTRTGASTGTGYAVTFQLDRAVAIEFVQAASGTAGRGDTATMARAEYRLLRHAEPGFSLAVTSRPLVASLVYWAVAVALAGSLLLVPWWLGRRRTRLALKQQARVHYEIRSRGRKAVRRHQTPAWARPRR